MFDLTVRKRNTLSAKVCKITSKINDIFFSPENEYRDILLRIIKHDLLAELMGMDGDLLILINFISLII